jgi:hypothetical protein
MKPQIAQRTPCTYTYHLPIVVTTRRRRDWFRRRYWVECWDCELKLGPYAKIYEAHAAMSALEKMPARGSK